MQSTGAGSGRSFSLVVLGSVFIVFVVTAAVLGGFVLWSSAQVDKAGIDRQATRVISALGQQLEQMSHDQESVAMWDDTLAAVTRRDFTWLNNNVGHQMAMPAALIPVVFAEITVFAICCFTCAIGVAAASEVVRPDAMLSRTSFKST